MVVISVLLLIALGYGLFCFFRSKRISTTWKILILIGTIVLGSYLITWNKEVTRIEGQKEEEIMRKYWDDLTEDLQTKTYEVNYADNKVKFEVYDIHCNLMPDSAVNIIVSAYVTNTSNERFWSSKVFIDRHGDGKHAYIGHKDGEYYDAVTHGFARSGNTFIVVEPHRDGSSDFSFYVMPGVYDFVVSKTIIGKIDTEKYTKE